MEEVWRRTSLSLLASPCFILRLLGLETEGLLRLPGEGGDGRTFARSYSVSIFASKYMSVLTEFIEGLLVLVFCFSKNAVT